MAGPIDGWRYRNIDDNNAGRIMNTGNHGLGVFGLGDIMNCSDFGGTPELDSVGYGELDGM